jgi:glycosyltransferase domain-containing protein
MSNDKINLTIFIPTFNRPKYVLRQIKFWSNYDFIVHFLDGSDKPLKIDNINYRNIHYHHLPIPFNERLKEIKNLVKTEFSAFLCDDEFFMPSALNKCVRFLCSNNDYVSCIGYCLGFEYQDNKILSFQKFPVIGKSSLRSANPSMRILNKARNYMPSTYYSVVRSDVFVANCELVSGEYKSPYVGEIFFELGTALQGKSHVINELMWFRSYENLPISDSSFDRDLNFCHWWQNTSSQYEKDSSLDIFVRVMRESTNIKKTKLKKLIYSAIVTMCGIKGNKLNLLVLTSFLVKKIETLLGVGLYSNYHKKYNFDKKDIDFFVESELSNKGIHINKKDYENIKQHIVDSYDSNKKI